MEESKENAAGRINNATFLFFFSFRYSRGEIYFTYTVISLIALLFTVTPWKNLAT